MAAKAHRAASAGRQCAASPKGSARPGIAQIASVAEFSEAA